MPSGNVVLINEDTIPTEGGCLACFGRYTNEKEYFKSDICNIFDLEYKEVEDWSQYVSHLQVSAQSLTDKGSVFSRGTESYEKMEVVFELLANESVWADGFITKKWSDLTYGSCCEFKVHDISAQYTISCISILRRTLQEWVDIMYTCISEHGMNFQQAYFYAVQFICESFSDWSGDEQVMNLSRFSKPKLKAFLTGNFTPFGKFSDKSYADLLGYPQEVLNQWEDGTYLDGKTIPSGRRWVYCLTSIFNDALNITECGYISKGRTKALKALNRGGSKLEKLKGVYPNILGMADEEYGFKVEKGMFGNHLMCSDTQARDLSKGLNYLMEEFLK